MYYLVYRIWYGITSFFELIFPMFAKVGKVRAWAPRLRWPLHIICIILILAGLTYLNWVFDLQQLLIAPVSYLRIIWLPLLFLLIYANCWLAWWLWRLLGPDREFADHPDIEAAWKEAKQALHREGIDLKLTPLFLILGRPIGGEEALFRAARLEQPLKHIPRGEDAPLHVYAGPEGVFVTCAGASLLGRHALLLAADAAESAETMPEAGAQPADFDEEVLGRPSADTEAQQTESRADQVGVLFAEDEAASARRPRRPVGALLKDSAAIELQTDRLKYLCRLIARERRPLCPVNGVLVLASFEATASEAQATEAGALCQIDVLAARETLQVDCPHYVVLCDLERTIGSRDFVVRFPEERRERRIGKRFAFGSALEPGGVEQVIEEGVQWICSGLIPPLAFRLLRFPAASANALNEALAGNQRLYEFFFAIRERQPRISRLLKRAVQPAKTGAISLAGCYLICSGRNPLSEQAFVAGVFRQVIDCQNFVSWTPEAFGEEADYRWWTRIGYVGLFLFVVAVFVLMYFV